MQHIAIMNKKAGYIGNILSNVKKIESRWYVNKVKPWNCIKEGEVIFFKESGGKVTARAEVSKVMQYENLNKEIFEEIVSKYAKDINMRLTKYEGYYLPKRYCILIFLKNPQKVDPFEIKKEGFGNACAWMCVNNINDIIK